MGPRCRDDDGFTLIELLLVIVILGIVAAVVVFAVGGLRKDAVATVCRHEVQSLTRAAEQLKVQTGVDPPDADSASPAPFVGPGGPLKSWPGSSDFALLWTQDIASVEVYNPKADVTTEGIAGCDTLGSTTATTVAVPSGPPPRTHPGKGHHGNPHTP